jgi:hypothetical protein
MDWEILGPGALEQYAAAVPAALSSGRKRTGQRGGQLLLGIRQPSTNVQEPAGRPGG